VSLAALARRLAAGEVSPVEAVRASLAAIEALDPRLNAFISVRGDEALAEAAALERRAPNGPLWGVPLGVKDVVDVAGARTTAASKILADTVAGEDAVAVAALRAAGAVVVGKLNTHEFAFGARTTSPHFGPARNPWDPERIRGGSSGGSGAAVSAGLVPGALGTDTAGSIRIPACYCGVTGHRPTTGLVSNRGVVPVSWTFDAVGPLARAAEDCALVLDAMAPSAGATAALAVGVGRLRVGVVGALFEHELLDPDIAAACVAAVDELRAVVASVEPVEVPLLGRAGVAQQLVMLPEASAAHRPWLRTRLADYGDDVRARLLAGLFLPSTAYVTGLRARRLFREGLDRVFEGVDVLVAPSMPVRPPQLDEETVEAGGRRVPYRLGLIPFNSPWSLAGAPVASVPCGLAGGLPAGLAVVGRPGEDATVLRVAHAFQSVTGWHELRPPIASDA
jgi:aspartyl-tRNA(Asn)/glutamyl-tRNA(Gln) amidotransferase subunit A